MVYCVQARIVFNTQAKCDQIAAIVAARIAGKPRWGLDAVGSWPSPITSDPTLFVTLRFTTPADRDDVEAELRARVADRLPRPGTYIAVHPCSHDGSAGSCNATVTASW